MLSRGQRIALMSKLNCQQKSDVDTWVNTQADFVMKVRLLFVLHISVAVI